ncbi:sodium:calcium antiporter, partial [Eubacteriales bacterium OttesenSCG-928-G02]|nr:sodium:calcium antiporter [Eubacteriales bacterium OttesenSCG-928-G02]
PSIILIVIFVIAMGENVRNAVITLKMQKKVEAETGFSFPPENDLDSPVPQSKRTAATRREIVINILKFVLGAVALVIGSRLLVDNGSEIAAFLGVPERIIAISFVAIGTSLPELVTTITAITKKQSSLSVGNIIGANIIDLTLILPVSSLISGKPLLFTEQISRIDMPACLIVGCVATLPSLITKKFHRWQGFLLIAIYIGYMVLSVI